MPKANTLVSLIQSVPSNIESEHPKSRLRIPAVVLPGDQEVDFDPSLHEQAKAAKRKLLKRLLAIRWPGYFVLNTERQIKDVQVPVSGKVTSLRPVTGGGWSVTTTGSATRFTIYRRSDPENFAFLEEHATVGVALVRDRRRGLDVHAIPSGFVSRTPDYEDLQRTGREVLEGTSVLDSEKDVIDIFNELVAETCGLPTPSAGCIPFLYPHDGCEARAHRMAEILRDRKESITVAKAWQFGGGLVFETDNAECHFVEWGHHTAVFLRVKANKKNEIRVLDPSMFTGPVTHSDWYNAMGGASPSVFCERHIFMVDPLAQHRGRVEDPDPEGAGIRETERDLQRWAGELETAAEGGTTPPPFPAPNPPC